MVEIKPINELIEEISPHYARRAKKKKQGVLDSVAEAEHILIYESTTETLEPIYFFILDLMEEQGLKIEKLVDNFTSSPGSGHFAELSQRATIMQQQGSKILGDVNTVLRSVLNIIYDLKDFRIRLQSYDDLHAKDKNNIQAARLALKQIWMDKVDINKGNSSIKAMALGQAGFQTLIDAFLVVDDVSLKGPDGKRIDLNERVQRIVTSRISEFNTWIKQSEIELRKRYELEKNYLRSQVSSLKLYSRWARPYLVAASRLQGKDQGRNPDIVNVFNTLLLELTLLGKIELRVKESAIEGDLPKDFIKDSFLKSLKRKYYGCVLVDFKFRGIPQRVAQQSHFTFGGRAQVTFRAYSLNEDELAKLDQELGKSDLADILALIEGSTQESLTQMQKEIDFFLDEKDEIPDSSPKESSNPFLALFGVYKKSESKPKKEKKGSKKEIIVKKDNWLEKEHLRKLSSEKMVEKAYTLFDIYKKAHKMYSYDQILD